MTEPMHEDEDEDDVITEVCALIKAEAFEEALKVRQKYTDSSAEWCYLNALIQFCIHGDGLTARAALAKAFSVGYSIPKRLIEGHFRSAELIAEIAKLTGEDFDPFAELEPYIEATEPAWQANNAIDWLRNSYNDPFNFFNRETIAIGKHFDDFERFQRFDDLIDSSEKFLQNKQDKEAKDALRAAVREAERIDYTAFPFYFSMFELIDFYVKSHRPIDDLRIKLSERAKKFDTSLANAEPMHALHLDVISRLYAALGQVDEAADYLLSALNMAEHFTGANQSYLTLFETSEIRYDLASKLFDLERFSEAYAYFLKNAEVRESYLGNNHEDVLNSLEDARDCLLQMNEEADAAILQKQIDERF